MKYFVLISAWLVSCYTVKAQNDAAALVNPFIGTGGHGHTFPGATMPFGMMQLSPDTRMADWDGSSGYHYSDSVIYGFSHTHLSGTGIPDYCDVLFMPFTGNVQWDPKEYRSTFSHRRENASPGYYEVFLERQRVRAQLTTSLRSGMHQYTFAPGETTGSILIDLHHRDQVLDSHIEQVSPYEIRGYRRSRSWAQDQVVYFHAVFEKPLSAFVINMDDTVRQQPRAQGKNIRAFVRVPLGGDRQLRCRIGISGVSMEGARNNLLHEIRDWNFEAVKKQARAAWNRELGKISVRGGTHDQRVVFYTALYHTMIAPNLFQDVDGRYRGTDGKTHEASGFRNYTVFSLWDTYRALHPLMNMIDRKRSADWIRTFLAQYKNGGMLPVWELAGNETFCMIGYHSVPVILDAWVKGIRNFDTTLALEAMRSYAESDRFGLDQYRQRGYISNNHEHESVSKTLEYAYDDWCIAQFARLTGHDSVSRHYLRRAQYYMNVFDPSTGHMRGKTDARWYHPFEAREINNFFTEGNSWQYTFAVPHDVQTLITLHGGPGKFVEKLDELFTTTSQTTGREQPDVTGLIGQYAHGNEPSHHMAYLFNYAGMPWRTQELVHRICNEFYKNAPDGLIGNEDCGQMSAWYVFSAMGFYPVCPGNGDYIIGTPVFDEVTIHLENGKHVRISANREARDHHYVRSVILNGKPHQRNWLRHADLANGAEIRFDLVSSPVRTWGADAAALPMSKISGPSIVPVPFADVPSEKFRNTIEVPLKTIDSNARIVYSIDDSLFNDPVTYSTPVRIDRSATLYMHAVNGLDRSHTVQQYFHRIPNNYSIRVLSTVHPMYTAGGHDVLVDGLVGNSNWRSGGWQSYFDQDFEAVVDLGKDTVVSEVGIHVLQDVSPWIVYPKEVVFYTSTDGITFSEAGRAINEKANDDKMVQTQVLAIRKTMHARYLKVRAVSGGKLPAWHESAGSPSHLFIDEIVIR